MPQVEAVQTPSTPAIVGGALVRGYRAVVGKEPPSANSWILPLAQAAVETANFKGGLWNNNIGNITTAHPDADDWMFLPNNGLKFRSYPSLDAGAAALLSWLHARGALPYADAGDIPGYVAALQRACYVGCDPAPYPQYQANIQSYVSRFGGVVPAAGSPGWKTLAICAAVLTASGLVAFYILEGEPPLGRLLRV